MAVSVSLKWTAKAEARVEGAVEGAGTDDAAQIPRKILGGRMGEGFGRDAYAPRRSDNVFD